MKRCLLAAVMVMALFLLVYAALSVAGPQGASAEESALRQVAAQFESAWARSDAHAMADLFAADGDLIIPTGLVMRGQAEIEAFYGGVFAQGYSGSQAGSEIARIRFLRTDLALVDGTWSIRNIPGKGGAAAARKDEFGTLALVAVKTPAGWRIAALRESDSAKSFHLFAEMTKH